MTITNESNARPKRTPTGLSDGELGAALGVLAARKKYMGLLVGLCVIAAVVLGIMGKYALLVLALLAACVCALMSLNAGGKMRRMLKADIVGDILAQRFADCVYHPDWGFSAESVSGTRLIDNWDALSGSDYVSGKYRGRCIEFADIELLKITFEIEEDEEGNETEREFRETVFLGQWISCELDRPLNATVRLREKKERTGIAKKLLGDRQHARSDIETENAAFNDRFQILASDPDAAFYVLTPRFMECIMAADRQANGQIYFCFAGQWVHIAIHNNRNFFELKGGGAAPADVSALQARIKEEVKYITDILDKLFENENLFAEEEPQ